MDDENDALITKMHTDMMEIKKRALSSYMESKLFNLFQTFEESGIQIKNVTVDHVEGKLTGVHLIMED